MLTVGLNLKPRVKKGFDSDAQAFFTRVTVAGGTLSATEKLATNQLVLDMKSAGIWSSMKAIYPMVGASAAACAQNLVSSSFTGTFSSGWTFASTGVTPNGTSAFMNTNYNQTTAGDSLNSAHLSFYSRTNVNTAQVEIGLQTPIPTTYNLLELRTAGITYFSINTNGLPTYTDANSLGFYVGNRQAATDLDLWKNGTKVINGTTASSVLPNANIYIGAFNNNGAAAFFSTKECALASIGDGLTDTQASNFYTNVQTFNTTLSRAVGPQLVSDADAQAYIYRVYAAGGTLTNTEATAVNQLTIDMKASNVWTSMKAIYPMVGASASACAQNLKSSSFTGTFSSGWTFASTGVTPNGTSAYMDSNLNASGNLTANNWHLSYYSRTNNAVGVDFDFGTGDSIGNFSSSLFLRRSGNTSAFDSGNASGNFRISTTITDSTGFFVGKITSSSDRKYLRNNSVIASSITTNSNVLHSYNLYLAAYNQVGTALYFGSKQCAFASIGNGLTDLQASDFYTNVQTFNTTLSRQV